MQAGFSEIDPGRTHARLFEIFDGAMLERRMERGFAIDDQHRHLGEIGQLPSWSFLQPAAYEIGPVRLVLLHEGEFRRRGRPRRIAHRDGSEPPSPYRR